MILLQLAHWNGSNGFEARSPSSAFLVVDREILSEWHEFSLGKTIYNSKHNA